MPIHPRGSYVTQKHLLNNQNQFILKKRVFFYEINIIIFKFYGGAGWGGGERGAQIKNKKTTELELSLNSPALSIFQTLVNYYFLHSDRLRL
jgi:hypothetical protein